MTACGYKTFALARVVRLPGGGKGYVYYENGTKVEYIVPPAGFSPVTAPSSQLKEYGIPARPSSAGQLARWKAEMGRAKAVTPPPFVAESRSRSYTYASSNNWSGYVAHGADGTYNHAEVWYYEPTYYSSSCSTTAASEWAGIGGYYSNTWSLGQDGTTHGVPGIGNHQAWYEWLDPANGTGISMTPVDLYGTRNYIFDASTYYNSNGYYVFYMENSYSGNYVAVRYYESYKDTRTAEAITERPEHNGSYYDLSNYKTMTYAETQANGIALNKASKLYQLEMYDKRDMADTSGIQSGGYFTDSQHHCSP